jgi:hypothetical protein
LRAQLIWVAGLFACSPAPAPLPAPAATTAPAGASQATVTVPVPAASSAPRPVEPAPPAEPPAVEVLAFEHVHTEPVRSLAMGHDGRVAVIEKEPWLFDGKRWQEIPLPEALRTPAGATDAVQIFFGRDNRPRIMGTRTSAEGRTEIYLRYKNGWRKEPKEIGSLANKPHEGLFGVLGHDDPEVVCRIGDICILKRLTGWTIIKAGADPALVVVAQESAWALYPDRIAQVSNDGWKLLPGTLPFRDPRGLWASAEGILWASAADGVYRRDPPPTQGADWQREDAPAIGARGLWGSNASDVWAAGDRGALHFDGSRWVRVAGIEGPLEHVAGTGAHDVWLAGESGLWHGVKP